MEKIFDFYFQLIKIKKNIGLKSDGIENLFIFLKFQIWPHSSMDRIEVSKTLDTGSIPVEATF